MEKIPYESLIVENSKIGTPAGAGSSSRDEIERWGPVWG